jgi:TonB family protein
MDAEPLIGWDKYNRYLDSNKKIPADEPRLQGEVVLSFKVSSKGELSSFDVEQSLSKSYDKEAIRLIKEGPGWRVTNGKKTRVKVIVRF